MTGEVERNIWGSENRLRRVTCNVTVPDAGVVKVEFLAKLLVSLHAPPGISPPVTSKR